MYDDEQLAFAAALAEAHYRWSGGELKRRAADAEVAQNNRDGNLHSVDVDVRPGSEERLARELRRLGWVMDGPNGKPRRVKPS